MSKVTGALQGPSPLDALSGRVELPAAREASGESFGAALEEAIGEVRGTLAGADTATRDALVGDGQPHTAMIAMTQADLSFRFAMQLRNKALEAYREIMNLPV
jgi:flagellar hook-basal body complex protein FliE